MSSRASTLTAVAAIVLAGCGFKPLYAERQGASVTDELALVRIDLIPDRTGQLLHNELLDRVNARGRPTEPRFRLVVSLSEATENLAIRKDDTATRANLILSADFFLADFESSETLLAGTLRSVNSYDISSFEFATVSAEADARRRGARDLAEEITARLALFLSDTDTSR